MGLTRDRILYFPVTDISEIGEKRREAVDYAQELGFKRDDSEEIAIIVSEMMTNILDHGGSEGVLILCRVQDATGNNGMEMWGIDNGKGIKNIKQATKDGYSSGNSLGLGLGTIRRLSDEVEADIREIPEEIQPKDFIQLREGLVICSRKWLPLSPWTGKNKNISIGAASRPKPGEKMNGDGFIIRHLSCTKTLVTVVDGLGHGKYAYEASQLALKNIKARANLPLPELIKLVHKTLLGTRGVTLGAALIDTEIQKVSFIGAGNIEARIVTPHKKHALISLGGIVGLKIRTPQVYEYKYRPDNFLVLYSDGINSRWQHDYDDWDRHPQSIAEDILKNFAKNHDDATILIVKLSPEDN